MEPTAPAQSNFSVLPRYLAVAYLRLVRSNARALEFMNDTDQIKMLLSMFAVQLPILLVCFVASLVILGRWKEASKGAMWALLGFGLATVLCFFMPLAQAGLQKWMQSGGTVAERAPVFAAVGFLWSVLRAVTYALLLVAVFAGRSVSPSASSSQ